MITPGRSGELGIDWSSEASSPPESDVAVGEDPALMPADVPLLALDDSSPAISPLKSSVTITVKDISCDGVTSVTRAVGGIGAKTKTWSCPALVTRTRRPA